MKPSKNAIDYASEQAKGFRKSFEQMERRLAHVESLLGLITWLQSNKYRVLMHRHDGNFRAIDEASREVWNADSLNDLETAIHTEPPQKL